MVGARLHPNAAILLRVIALDEEGRYVLGEHEVNVSNFLADSVEHRESLRAAKTRTQNVRHLNLLALRHKLPGSANVNVGVKR